MDWDNPKQVRAFLTLHSQNPREGPGDRDSTGRALAAARTGLGLSDSGINHILDVACGPGMQTRHLHEFAPEARITAFDVNERFVKSVQDWAAQAGLAQQIAAVAGDMQAPPVAPASVDVIWCEGAAYMLGVQEALELWRPLLRTPGIVALTEPVFLTTDLPDLVVKNWEEYPPMTDMPGVAARVAAAGYELLEQFVLPPLAWAEYYDPLQRRIDVLRDRYADDPDGALVIAEGQSEIDVWKQHGDCFSYAFFVARSQP